MLFLLFLISLTFGAYNCANDAHCKRCNTQNDSCEECTENYMKKMENVNIKENQDVKVGQQLIMQEMFVQNVHMDIK